MPLPQYTIFLQITQGPLRKTRHNPIVVAREKKVWYNTYTVEIELRLLPLYFLRNIRKWHGRVKYYGKLC